MQRTALKLRRFFLDLWESLVRDSSIQQLGCNPGGISRSKHPHLNVSFRSVGIAASAARTAAREGRFTRVQDGQ